VPAEPGKWLERFGRLGLIFSWVVPKNLKRIKKQSVKIHQLRPGV